MLGFKGEKRRKELSRQEKQEERRQLRFHKGDHTPSDAEKVEQEGTRGTILNPIHRYPSKVVAQGDAEKERQKVWLKNYL